MNLKLSVGGKVLASIPVDPSKCDEYYLKAFRRQLIIRYRSSIVAHNSEPAFVMEEPLLNKKVAVR